MFRGRVLLSMALSPHNRSKARVLRGVAAFMCIVLLLRMSWRNGKAPLIPASSPSLFRNPLGNGCPSENELRLKDYMDEWERNLTHALKNTSEDAGYWTKSTSWHAVTEDVRVFSAYLATTTVRGVHAVGLVRRTAMQPNAFEVPRLSCRIKTADGRTLAKRTQVRPLPEQSAFEFRAVILVCPLRKNDDRVFTSVSFASKGSEPIVWLPIESPPSAARAKCCSLCVKPAYGQGPRLWELIEVVTHHHIIGCGSVFLYDLNMSRSLLSLVGRMQAAQWDVTLVPFKLPPPWNGSVDPQGWGEAAALADCAFRSRLKTEYFIHLDFEELMIVGDYNGSLTALIEHVERKLGKNNVSTLLAESRRFCYEYGLDEAHLARRGLPFRSMLLRRHSGDLGDQTRTAFIARSSAVCAAGDPSMVRHRGAAKELQFVASVLRTHRYVRCCDRTAEPAGRIGSMNYKYPESTHVALTPSTFIKKYKDRLHGLLLSIQLGKAS